MKVKHFFLILTVFLMFNFVAGVSCGDDDDDDDSGADPDDDDDDSVDDDDDNDDSTDDDDDSTDDDDDDTAPSNYALQFDGLDDYVSIPEDSAFNITGHQLTVEFWSFANDDDTIQVFVSNQDANFNGYKLRTGRTAETPTRLQWVVGSTGTEGCYIDTTTNMVPTNEWFHLAGVKDGNTFTIYLNGQEVAKDVRDDCLALSPSISNLYIGRRAQESQYFLGGRMAHVRVSNVARYTSDFIPDEYLLEDADTVGLWKLDEGTGTTAGDSSGNGNDGTVFGAIWVER